MVAANAPGWEYRVCEFAEPEGMAAPHFAIRNLRIEDGQVVGWSYGLNEAKTLEALTDYHRAVLEAFDKPVLRHSAETGWQL